MHMDRTLRIYSAIPRTHALGPYTRFALWVQGCPFRCAGCMTPGSLPFDGGTEVPLSELFEWISGQPDIEGLTISGGEPFLQAGALAALINALREARDLGLIVYSGYKLATLRHLSAKDPTIGEFLDQIDLLIDGPYVASKNDGSPLRGSSNQGIRPLTDRYLRDLHLYDAGQPRQVEIHVEADMRMLVGVPSVRQLAWWKERSASFREMDQNQTIGVSS